MRAAVVGGAAYHAGKRVQQGREAEYEQDERLAALESQQAAAAYAPPPAAAAPAAGGISSDAIAKLEQLAQLKDSGVISEEEFDVQKRRLLGTA
jgi:hypothetical protein